jgi:hypothetical protein
VKGKLRAMSGDWTYGFKIVARTQRFSLLQNTLADGMCLVFSQGLPDSFSPTGQIGHSPFLYVLEGAAMVGAGGGTWAVVSRSAEPHTLLLGRRGPRMPSMSAIQFMRDIITNGQGSS